MGVLLKIFPDQRLVYSEFYDEVTDGEILQHGRAIKSDPRFDPSFSEIVDFTRVTEVNVSENTLKQLASAKSVFSPDSKHAVIAPIAPVYELARIYQGKADSRILAVVLTREQACKFLGIDHLQD
jgi:hypothetical protein